MMYYRNTSGDDAWAQAVTVAPESTPDGGQIIRAQFGAVTLVAPGDLIMLPQEIESNIFIPEADQAAAATEVAADAAAAAAAADAAAAAAALNNTPGAPQ